MAKNDEGKTPSYQERNDGRLDLILQRVIDVPRAFVWKVWTDPQHLVRWWAPRPWSTVDCTMDLRPGGAMRTVLRSPEGQDFPYVGCFLEVVPQEKLVLTNALEPRLPAVARPVLHRHHHAQGSGRKDRLHRARSPSRRGGQEEARGDGLPPGLG